MFVLRLLTACIVPVILILRIGSGAFEASLSHSKHLLAALTGPTRVEAKVRDIRWTP
jgi:hypothetical protein